MSPHSSRRTRGTRVTTVTPDVNALAVKIKDTAWLNSKSKPKPKKHNSLFKTHTDMQADRKKMENGTPSESMKYEQTYEMKQKQNHEHEFLYSAWTKYPTGAT